MAVKYSRIMGNWHNTVLERAVLLTMFQKILIVLFGIVFMGAGLYFAMFQHRLEELAKQRKNLVFRQRLLGAYQSKAEAFEKFSRQMQSKNHQFLSAAAAIPGNRQSARLLDDLSRAGKAAHINLLSLREEKEIVLDFYKKIPWTIQVSGSYARLMEFLRRIASMDRMVVIEKMTLKREKKDSLIYMDCTAVAFTCGE